MNISERYDEVYSKMQDLLTKTNPCRIKKDDQGKVSCCGEDNPCLCCSGCKHLSPDGCAVKSLACKLWLCGEAMRNALRDPAFVAEYSKLLDEAKEIPHYYRASKEENFLEKVNR
jgi:hypothetical protein